MLPFGEKLGVEVDSDVAKCSMKPGQAGNKEN